MTVAAGHVWTGWDSDTVIKTVPRPRMTYRFLLVSSRPADKISPVAICISVPESKNALTVPSGNYRYIIPS